MLGKATTFVEAARLVCDEARRIGALRCSIAVQRDGGAVVLVVDSATDASDVSLGEPFALPLITPGGLCGVIDFVLASKDATSVERQLAMLATQLCVWCTERGISTVPTFEQLGPRQHRIAELAARGHTNAEIGEALAISINTVKSRLKEIFERLGVNNRTELANVMRRLAPLHGVPPGISRYKNVFVTRSEAPRRERKTIARRGNPGRATAK